MNPLNEVKLYVEYQVKGISRLDEGQQLIYRFENDYGASVIYRYGSYGFEEGLLELGVIIWNGNQWNLTYSTKITNDVIGYLSPKRVENLLKKIKEL